MEERIVLAVPTLGEGGLDAERSAHFGHCDCFTVVEIDNGAVTNVKVVANPPHEEGGCLRPVGLLAGHGVNALIAAGMGPRPLAGFRDAGITVYFENLTTGMREAVDLVARGGAVAMDPSQSCGHHH
jgi:predicted Fe-Mo cluster-binding NifX family protein